MASRSDKHSDADRRDARQALQHDRPAVTNRAWGRDVDPGDLSFGKEGQGGYGDFRTGEPAGDRRGAAAGDAQDGGTPDARDRHVRAVVADTLARSDALDASQVLVSAEDGVVTLTGEVPEAPMKARAADVARQVPGVRDVRNVISVDDGRASFGPPGQAVRGD